MRMGATGLADEGDGPPFFSVYLPRYLSISILFATNFFYFSSLFVQECITAVLRVSLVVAQLAG